MLPPFMKKKLSNGFSAAVINPGRFYSLCAAVLLAICGTGGASTLTWDGGDAAANTVFGGTGTWDTGTSANWTGGAGGVQWTDTAGTDVAVFTGTAGGDHGEWGGDGE